MTIVGLALAIAALGGGPSPVVVAEGSSPQVAIDTRGVVRMIFGRKDSIFAVTSRDNGVTFSRPVVVGVVARMHLGNTRGPTIASSRSRTIVMAIDTRGDIYTFELDHASDRWERNAGTLNDSTGSAPEGLATIAADNADNFFAVWLDVRHGRQNQVYFARLPARAGKAEPNRLVYASPAGHVCECCRPSIAVADRRIAVMFRNWIGGNRDMYVTQSSDAGRTFAPPAKLGVESWKLDACPMDGGAVSIDRSGTIHTTWRRELTVFVAEPGKKEKEIGEGRSPMMARTGDGTYVVWQRGRSVVLKLLETGEETIVGEGRLPQVLALRGGSMLVAWESAGSVMFTRK